MWKPKWLGVICASIVTLLQTGHNGRKDMFARLDGAGAQHSQSPVGCRYRDGDQSMMRVAIQARCSVLLSSLTVQKKINFGATEAALVLGLGIVLPGALVGKRLIEEFFKSLRGLFQEAQPTLSHPQP
jgi:hypothetical protein